MRRKSTRNAAKASPEKAKPEPRKTRYSTRNKKSITPSSSDNSGDESDSIPLSKINSAESEDKRTSNNKRNKAETDKKQVSIEESKNDSKPNEDNEGNKNDDENTDRDDAKTEIENIEIKVDNESDKSAVEGNVREEIAGEITEREKQNEDEINENLKVTRREDCTRKDSSKEEVSLVKEEDESEGSKGKSKSKNKSNVEKTTQQGEFEAQAEKIISENVQVTPLSPSRTDNPVNNDPERDSNFNDDTKQNAYDTQTDIKVSEESKNETIKNEQIKSSNDVNVEKNSVSHPENSESATEEYKDKNEKVNAEYEAWVPGNGEHLSENWSEMSKVAVSKTTEEKMEEDNSSEHSSSSTEPGELPKIKLQLKRILDQDNEGEKIISKKQNWGEALADLDNVMPALIRISFEEINNLCPSVQLLDENDVKLDITESTRRISLDKKKIERKISIEHRTSESDNIEFSYAEDTSMEVEENANIIAMNRKISIVEDTASKLRPPPSPAKNPVSAVLYITNLVRPFTLKQLKEMLERTGKIREDGFWTDKIKSKCYVHYETEEEAEATRNAIHGINWPISNGKKLHIEYATPEDMESARNPPLTLLVEPVAVPESIKENIPEKNTAVPLQVEENVDRDKEKRKNETHVREWDVGKVDSHKRRSRTRSRSRHRGRERSKERHRRRRSPSHSEDYITRKQKKEEEAVPQKLMDDLFRKTKAMPSVYWIPLTPEEIQMKQQQRLQRMAEHKRRIEESRTRDYGRGGHYRRRFD